MRIGKKALRAKSKRASFFGRTTGTDFLAFGGGVDVDFAATEGELAREEVADAGVDDHAELAFVVIDASLCVG